MSKAFIKEDGSNVFNIHKGSEVCVIQKGYSPTGFDATGQSQVSGFFKVIEVNPESSPDWDDVLWLSTEEGLIRYIGNTFTGIVIVSKRVYIVEEGEITNG